MRFFYLFLSLTLLCCAAQPSYAKRHVRTRTNTQARATVSRIYGANQLVGELNRIIGPKTNSAEIGVYVKSMNTPGSLYSYNVNQPLTPASTMKILTAETALIFLGSNYRFSTQLLTDAKSVKNGVLQGNLYVVFSGDPTLTYYDLADLLNSLRSQQITAIEGNVYIDNTAYDQSFYGPGWLTKDKKSAYGAPISASIINHNCLPVNVAAKRKPGKLNQVLTPNFYPSDRMALLAKSRSNTCLVRMSENSNSSIRIDNCLSKGPFNWGMNYVVTDIPDYNRALFKSLLSQLSISVYGSVTFGSAPQNLSLVGSHTSDPLPDLLKEMLKKSDNVIAGALFKKIGQLYSHQPGSWSNASNAVSQILAKRADVNIAGLRIVDGSGLSRDNQTTPAQLMQVLDYAYHQPATNQAFFSALPIAGVDGTLKHRMYNVARKVHAKTGTISGVTSLAGYAISADNEPIAFVVIVNCRLGMGWRYKSIEDQIATAITKYTARTV